MPAIFPISESRRSRCCRAASRSDTTVPARRCGSSPDQSCAYDTVSGRLAVRNVRASNYGSWTGDSIVFDNMTLEDIAVNLEHWYNIRIRIDDGVDASTRISFTLRPETLDETLRIIENLTHFACERTDRQHITIRKR